MTEDLIFLLFPAYLLFFFKKKYPINEGVGGGGE